MDVDASATNATRAEGSETSAAQLAPTDTPVLEETCSTETETGEQRQQRPSQLGMVYLNARSVKSVTSKHNKLEQLGTLVSDYSPDIVVITETWLIPSVRDSEVLPSNFTLHRRDRVDAGCDKRGGGILIDVNESLPSSRRTDLEPNDAEIIVCELNPYRHGKIALIICYRPQTTDVDFFTECMYKVLDSVSKEYEYVNVIGDCNFPGVDWQTLQFIPSLSSGPNATPFLDVVSTFSLVQINRVPSNVFGNILDLVLTNTPELYSEPVKLPCDFRSDHVVLHCDLFLRKHPKKRFQRRVFNYKAADFTCVRNQLNEAQLCDVVNRCNDVETAWQSWLETVNEVAERCIPKVEVKDSTAPPWVDSEVRHLQRLKRTAWRKARRTGNWSKFRTLRNKLKKLVRAKQKSFLAEMGEQCEQNPKRFWTYYRSKTKTKNLPPVIKHDDCSAHDAESKANMFNEYFYSTFTSVDNIELPDVTGFVDHNLSNVLFDSDRVRAYLRELDVSKACGPDNLSPRLLKQCSSELAPSLKLLYQMSMESGLIPCQWKEANVAPVFKKGSKECVNNYRPISLLCIVSKVMEKCIYNHVFPAVEPHIYSLQHGFVRGRSCATQLLHVYNNIGHTLDQGGQTDIVYLDISKAFDSVPHALIVHKLRMYGFNGNLLRWLESYLSGRRQRVLVEGSLSDWLPVTSGVPQGSILGPLLFLLYINDMPSVVRSAKIALFADDAKLVMKISNVEDCLALQDDLNNLSDWGKTWGMYFNVSKCKVLTVSRSHNPFTKEYCINENILEHVGNFKDLGVVIDSKLTFREHVRTLINKANAVNGMIKRTFGYNAPLNVKRTLYTSLTRSVLEYCSTVWSPFLHSDIMGIERVQRSMTRFMLGYPDGVSYPERCLTLNILPLSYRRQFNDLLFLFKIIHGIHCTDFQSKLRLVQVNSGLRSGNQGTLLRSNLVSTCNFQNSYLIRIVPTWNSLPRELRDCSNLQQFKRGLNDHFTTKLQESYNPDQPCTW